MGNLFLGKVLFLKGNSETSHSVAVSCLKFSRESRNVPQKGTNNWGIKPSVLQDYAGPHRRQTAWKPWCLLSAGDPGICSIQQFSGDPQHTHCRQHLQVDKCWFSKLFPFLLLWGLLEGHVGYPPSSRLSAGPFILPYQQCYRWRVRPSGRRIQCL